jgi:hypothetical protein
MFDFWQAMARLYPLVHDAKNTNGNLVNGEKLTNGEAV